MSETFVELSRTTALYTSILVYLRYVPRLQWNYIMLGRSNFCHLCKTIGETFIFSIYDSFPRASLEYVSRVINHVLNKDELPNIFSYLPS